MKMSLVAGFTTVHAQPSARKVVRKLTTSNIRTAKGANKMSWVNLSNEKRGGKKEKKEKRGEKKKKRKKNFFFFESRGCGVVYCLEVWQSRKIEIG